MQALATFTLWFILFVNVGRFQEIFPVLVPFQLGKVSIALGLVVVCTQNFRDLQTFLFNSPIKKYLLTIVALALLGIPFSVYISDAIGKFNGLMQLFLIASVVVALGRKNSVSMKLCFIFILLFISTQVALQKATGRISVSQTYDPNDIALLSIILLPIALSGLSHSNFIIKICSLAASGGGVICIALSGSRGGLLALIAVAIYAIILAKKRRLVLITLCVIGGVIFSAMAGDALWERIQALRDGTDYNFSTEGDSRFAIWSSALEIMLKRPIFGVGIGQFITGLATLSDTPWRTAHNSFIQIGMELGLGGIWAFCSILLFIYRLSKRGSSAPFLTEEQQTAYTYLRLSLLGFCVGGFFISHAYSSITYALICFSVVMHFTLEDAQKFALKNTMANHEDAASPSQQPAFIHITPNNATQNTLAPHIVKAQVKRNTRKSRLEAGDNLRKNNLSKNP